MKIRNIKSLSKDELAAWLIGHGQPAFRRAQIYDWLYRKWVTAFDDMRNIPTSLHNELATRFSAFSIIPIDRQTAQDGATKFLLKLSDANTIETVILHAADRYTVCISTQVGCPVQCAFCASGRHGLVRNLEPGEIVDQVIFACRHLGVRISNVVVMGMGEPLLNLHNTIAALDALCDPERMAMSARRITISTSGIPDGIRALADHGVPWNLALSLHAVTDKKRAAIIPAVWCSPLSTVLKACEYYKQTTGRVVTLEYTLIPGKNDYPEDCRGLASIATTLHAKVNVIPLSATGAHFRVPSQKQIRDFVHELQRQGAPVTIRESKGASIEAACGQLRSRDKPAGGDSEATATSGTESL
ncbi:MAG: 23S rRNA (adenine(2503)-C(2))-methyltransferase RlmN [Candidatus Pacebacteria bacterium]|nr:23S rRNA (adenine(2503)-C(2))-methyltransferase RlmN [Candidatus Paceibacterota bacterium]